MKIHSISGRKNSCSGRFSDEEISYDVEEGFESKWGLYLRGDLPVSDTFSNFIKNKLIELGFLDTAGYPISVVEEIGIRGLFDFSGECEYDSEFQGEPGHGGMVDYYEQDIDIVAAKFIIKSTNDIIEIPNEFLLELNEIYSDVLDIDADELDGMTDLPYPKSI